MVAEGYSPIGYYIQFSSTIVFIVAGFSHVTSYYMQFCSTIVFMVAEVFFTLLVTIRSSVLHLCSWLMKFYSHYWLFICSSVLHYVHGCLRLFTLLVTIMQFCSTIVFMVVEITSYLLYGAV